MLDHPDVFEGAVTLHYNGGIAELDLALRLCELDVIILPSPDTTVWLETPQGTLYGLDRVLNYLLRPPATRHWLTAAAC